MLCDYLPLRTGLYVKGKTVKSQFFVLTPTFPNAKQISSFTSKILK